MTSRFVLTLWTDDSDVAARADTAGIDRIGPDLEVHGKQERQAGLGYRLSRHHPDCLPGLRSAVRAGALFARTDPVHAGSREQVEALLAAGVEVLMLPMFRTVGEVAQMHQLVAGRARLVALVEQREATCVLEQVLAEGLADEVHVGLNDLALSVGEANRFLLLVSPLLERVAAVTHTAGVPFGVGGMGRVGDRSLPIDPDLVYAQQVRLGASRAILARSFVTGAVDLTLEVQRARDRLAHWQQAEPAAMAAASLALRATA